MSMMQSQQTETNDMSIEIGSLPPRHTKHGRRRPERNRQDHIDVKSRNKGLYYIQIILYTFLALIAAVIVYYYVNTDSHEAMADKETADPLEIFLEREAQNHNKPDPRELSSSVVEQQESVMEQQEDTATQEKKAPSEEPREEVREEETDEQQPEIDQPAQDTSTQPKLRAVHTVQAGETLYSITMKYYKNKEYLNYVAQFNGIKDPTTDVKVGMKLSIPEP